MKPYYLLTGLACVIFIGLTSCRKTPQKVVHAMKSDTFHEHDTADVDSENPRLTAYRTFIQKLDSTDISSPLKAQGEFQTSFNGQSQGLCDSAFVVFQTLFDKVELALNAQHQNDTTDYEPLFSGSKTLSPSLKKFQHTLNVNGFRLALVDEMTYIEQDRAFVAQHFYPSLSPVMKEFLEEIRKENREGFAAKGGVSISPKQFAERTVWYEKFIAANPRFVSVDKCKNYQKAYLTYLFSGYGTTGLYTASGDLSPYFKTVYTFLLTKHSDTQTAQMLQPYYKAIKEKDQDKAKAILKELKIKGIILSL